MVILVDLNIEEAEQADKGSSNFVKGHQNLSLGEGTDWDGGPLNHHPNLPKLQPRAVLPCSGFSAEPAGQLVVALGTARHHSRGRGPF